MGVQLEIGKMFAYILIPISFFHYFSHKDPEYFRKTREEQTISTFGNVMKKTNDYTKHRIETGPASPDYDPKDVFWRYGEGLKYSEHKKQ